MISDRKCSKECAVARWGNWEPHSLGCPQRTEKDKKQEASGELNLDIIRDK